MTTYYVDGAVGNDSNAGTSEGAGNAWATVDKAMNTVTSGDHVYVKASATYSETATIDTAASYNNRIIFEGYTSTPGDNGKATISGGAGYALTEVGGGNHYYEFKNLIFTSGSATGVFCTATTYLTFINCEANNCGSNGFHVDDFCVFVNCTATGNTINGFYCGAGGYLVGCISYINSQIQYNCDGNLAFMYRCLAYGGGATYADAVINGCDFVIGNTFDGDGKNAAVNVVDNDGATQGVVVDNIFYDGGVGYDNASDTNSTRMIITNNLFNANNTDLNSTAVGAGIIYGNLTSAPAFTDEAGDDYTLGGTSPAIDAGVQPGGLT